MLTLGLKVASAWFDFCIIHPDSASLNILFPFTLFDQMS